MPQAEFDQLIDERKRPDMRQIRRVSRHLASLSRRGRGSPAACARSPATPPPERNHRRFPRQSIAESHPHRPTQSECQRQTQPPPYPPSQYHRRTTRHQTCPPLAFSTANTPTHTHPPRASGGAGRPDLPSTCRDVAPPLSATSDAAPLRGASPTAARRFLRARKTDSARQ